MTKEELVKSLKERLKFFQDEARKQTSRASIAVRRANDLEKQIKKIENSKEEE